MLSRAFLALLSLAVVSVVPSASAQTDTQICLSAPTRDCVFRIALDAVEREADTGHYVQDMLELASFADVSGEPSLDAILSSLLDNLTKREPKMAERAKILLRRSCVYIRNDAPSLPIVATRLVAELRAVAQLLPADESEGRAALLSAIARCYGMLGDVEAFNSLIGEAGLDEERLRTSWIYGLMRGRQVALLNDLPDETVPENLREQVNRAAFHQLSRAAFASAMEVIANVEDIETRIEKFRVAHGGAMTADERTAALSMAEALAAEIDGPLPSFLVEILAWPKAMAGDWQATLDLVARLQPGGRADKVASETLARLGGARGEYDVVLAMLDRSTDGYVGDETEAIIRAGMEGALQAGRVDIDLLLERLSGAALFAALHPVASHAMAKGDHAWAEFVYRRALAIDSRPWEIGGLRRDYAFWLAEQGHGREALALGWTRQDRMTLARIAIRLD